ncbi:methyltransferase domain-containing protein [Streptomyces benahoarensis]|uniref:Protein-L-isoaspartate O-methyltransferase n=1 Tax=Streptomyces benahoarensis TaxID=2595054 RepID=A0A553ZN50_9ACTN|nr:methyltransferase domain-containing protein [Streptomyces benahoarensis]TSB32010.1 methyltransferase domain-containing protein [Streptomyces benahoarensis]TSB42736.1 methyltransferase domain-containing protein [Streptomyces benahoarensis]
MTATAEDLRRACAEEMARYGEFDGCPWLRDAFSALPREHFVPDRVWWHRPRPDGLHTLIDRASAPHAWLTRVYAPGDPLITQIDDGAVAPTDDARGALTSSISSSAVIVELLRNLAPRPGEKTLEVGTGTGYTTALLAARVGGENVTTIEIDGQLAAGAAVRLAELGLRPHVVTGDGELGHLADCPYDRIVATASVRRIPQAWLDQLAPRGVLVVPLDSPLGWDLLLRLESTGPGTAQGCFVGRVEFMRTRGQRMPLGYDVLGWPAVADAAHWRDLRVDVGPEGQRISLPSVPSVAGAPG